MVGCDDKDMLKLSDKARLGSGAEAGSESACIACPPLSTSLVTVMISLRCPQPPLKYPDLSGCGLDVVSTHSHLTIEQ